MARSAEEQAPFDRRREELSGRYPQLWSKMIAEWNTPGPDDRAWLLYAANYLFRTDGVRWALDPLTLRRRVPSAPAVDLSPLAALDFVVLSHSHSDHFDPDLLRTMKDTSVRFVVPEFLLPSFRERTGIPERQVIVPVPLRPLDLGPLRLTPFEGLHLEPDPSRPGGVRGVPALGYLAEFSGKRWLFPGDTRRYEADRLPRFGPVDGLIAHLWLGRSGALQADLPLLEPFCRFCLALQPRRIVLAHLDEFGRDESECWNGEHARLAASSMKRVTPPLSVTIARAGDGLCL